MIERREGGKKVDNGNVNSFFFSFFSFSRHKSRNHQGPKVQDDQVLCRNQECEFEREITSLKTCCNTTCFRKIMNLSDEMIVDISKKNVHMYHIHTGWFLILEKWILGRSKSNIFHFCFVNVPLIHVGCRSLSFPYVFLQTCWFLRWNVVWA